MTPGLTQKTWSIAPSDTGPSCHAFFVTHGRATFLNPDGSTIELSAPVLLWLPRTTRGEFRLEAGSQGATCSIAEDFVWRAVGGSPMLASLRPLLDRITLASSERLSPRLAELDTLFAALVRESREGLPGAGAIMGLHLGLLLLHLWRASAQTPSTSTRGMGAMTAQRFRQLVEMHYRDNLGIDDFARLLSVTRTHLHDACLKATGRTPLNLVHDRLIEEARLRLEQTNLPVEQVGYSLGFRDAGYFNRFFKRLVGLSPGAHRKASADIRAVDNVPSFSAWP